MYPLTYRSNIDVTLVPVVDNHEPIGALMELTVSEVWPSLFLVRLVRRNGVNKASLRFRKRLNFSNLKDVSLKYSMKYGWVLHFGSKKRLDKSWKAIDIVSIFFRPEWSIRVRTFLVSVGINISKISQCQHYFRKTLQFLVVSYSVF